MSIELHQDHIIDLQDQENNRLAEIEEDKQESIRSFKALQHACKGFKQIYDGLMYMSDNNMVMDKMHTLEALLSDFDTTCDDALRMMDYYYEK